VSRHTKAVRVPLTTAEDESFMGVQHNAPSLLATIKNACHSMAAAAKRMVTVRMLCATMVSGLMLVHVPAGYSSIVTITINGTVATGLVGTGTNIAGQNFTLIATFDDTKGAQGKSACTTSITNSTTNPPTSPGTAVLTIGTNTWSFGSSTTPGETETSSAYRRLAGCLTAASLGYNIMEGGAGTTDDINVVVTPETGALTDGNWEDSFSATQLASSQIVATVPSPNFLTATLDATSVMVGGQSGSPSATGLQFVPVTPCRVADTRNATGSFGGPELAAGASREFDIPQSACSIPSSAVAYSLNVTAIPGGPLGYLTLWPSGQAQPTVSTLNSDGRIKANAAITPAGTNGGVSVFVTNESHVILDIDGYFVPAGTASALAFYPVTPCRVADTRNPNGSLGGPSLVGGTSRDFPVQSSNCALPSDAKAYSLNVTAIPKGALGYLTMWPSGQTQPLVSTLNSPTGAVAANGAIVPAASNGEVSVFVSNPSDVVLDVNGYFAAPSANGLSLYTTTPCRVIDTRNSAGAFNGVLAVVVESSSCAPSSTAQAYVLNATVVPSSSLGYLTLWPAGETQPVVSTLNAVDGAVTSNMAIVPTLNGSIDAFSSNPTQLILDLSSYFAP
jgi:hypothetical protein